MLVAVSSYQFCLSRPKPSLTITASFNLPYHVAKAGTQSFRCHVQLRYALTDILVHILLYPDGGCPSGEKRVL